MGGGSAIGTAGAVPLPRSYLQDMCVTRPLPPFALPLPDPTRTTPRAACPRRRPTRSPPIAAAVLPRPPAPASRPTPPRRPPAGGFAKPPGFPASGFRKISPTRGPMGFIAIAGALGECTRRRGAGSARLAAPALGARPPSLPRARAHTSALTRQTSLPLPSSTNPPPLVRHHGVRRAAPLPRRGGP